MSLPRRADRKKKSLTPPEMSRVSSPRAGNKNIVNNYQQNSKTIPGGLAEGMSPTDFDQQALAEGIQIEMEHTSDPAIAREIAMDHLVEDPHYYRRLGQMEQTETVSEKAIYRIRERVGPENRGNPSVYSDPENQGQFHHPYMVAYDPEPGDTERTFGSYYHPTLDEAHASAKYDGDLFLRRNGDPYIVRDEVAANRQDQELSAKLGLPHDTPRGIKEDMMRDSGYSDEEIAAHRQMLRDHNFSEKSLQGHKHGCLMAAIPDPLAKKITNWTSKNIPDEWLGSGGREDAPHVTVLYGFTDCSENTIERLREMLATLPPFQLRLVSASVFPSRGDGDVLKADVYCPELHHLNREILTRFKVHCKYDVYRPHLTLAYLCPEFTEQALRNLPPFIGAVVAVDTLVFSNPDGKKVRIKLRGTVGQQGTKDIYTLPTAAGENVHRVRLTARERSARKLSEARVREIEQANESRLNQKYPEGYVPQEQRQANLLDVIGAEYHARKDPDRFDPPTHTDLHAFYQQHGIPHDEHPGIVRDFMDDQGLASDHPLRRAQEMYEQELGQQGQQGIKAAPYLGVEVIPFQGSDGKTRYRVRSTYNRQLGHDPSQVDMDEQHNIDTEEERRAEQGQEPLNLTHDSVLPLIPHSRTATGESLSRWQTENDLHFATREGAENYAAKLAAGKVPRTHRSNREALEQGGAVVRNVETTHDLRKPHARPEGQQNEQKAIYRTGGPGPERGTTQIVTQGGESLGLSERNRIARRSARQLNEGKVPPITSPENAQILRNYKPAAEYPPEDPSEIQEDVKEIRRSKLDEQGRQTVTLHAEPEDEALYAAQSPFQVHGDALQEELNVTNVDPDEYSPSRYRPDAAARMSQTHARRRRAEAAEGLLYRVIETDEQTQADLDEIPHGTGLHKIPEYQADHEYLNIAADAAEEANKPEVSARLRAEAERRRKYPLDQSREPPSRAAKAIPETEEKGFMDDIERGITSPILGAIGGGLVGAARGYLEHPEAPIPHAVVRGAFGALTGATSNYLTRGTIRYLRNKLGQTQQTEDQSEQQTQEQPKRPKQPQQSQTPKPKKPPQSGKQKTLSAYAAGQGSELIGATVRENRFGKKKLSPPKLTARKNPYA